jgi:DNA polymerase-3 subunit delta'
MIRGQDRAVERFLSAWAGGTMHHAWLLAGPKGVGKASFARAAATRILAEAADPQLAGQGLAVDPQHRIARLIEANSHPDFRWIERVENKSGTALARNISVDQVRELGELFTVTPSFSDWRAVVIDSVDDMEPSAANALLKMLEEPPGKCLFLLVSHVPGRLLPTIRSRCRKLDFQALGNDVMASVLVDQAPGLDERTRQSLIDAAVGSAGRALAYANLDLAPLKDQAVAILYDGDPTNEQRSGLAKALGGKGAAERFAAFVEMVPTLIAGEARRLEGDSRLRALDAYAKARETGRMALRLSLDPATTAFRMGTILASIAPRDAAR